MAQVATVDPPERRSDGQSERALSTSQQLLEVRGLTCSIPSPQGEARILKGIDLTVGYGETIGLVGESGSGKTMLVRALMGIAPAKARVGGYAKLDGTDLLTAPRSVKERIWGRKVAMVFQDPMTSLNPVVRIGRQITEGMRKHLGLGRDEARRRAADLLASVGIPDPAERLRQYPHELSGGMRQRVMIAIALSCEPDLLITDEATTALDVTVQRQILDLLQTLQAERGMAIIMVSHDLGVVAGRTDRVAVMYSGRIVETAPTNSLFEHPHHRYTEALLAATPRIDRIDRSFASIPGSMPSAFARREECDFASRCAFTQDACRTETPELVVLPGRPHHAHRCLNPVGRSGSHPAQGRRR